jgi:hypothetical protein
VILEATFIPPLSVGDSSNPKYVFFLLSVQKGKKVSRTNSKI